MSKIIKSLQNQIDEYKLQFELSSELKQWFIDNPKPNNIRIPGTINFTDDYKKYCEKQRSKYLELISKGYNNKNWNWDDNWDGQLIRDVQALEQVGFTIVEFSRKRKVTLRTDNLQDAYEMVDDKLVLVNKRVHIISLITQAVDDSWYSISFKPTLSIYWR